MQNYIYIFEKIIKIKCDSNSFKDNHHIKTL